MKNAKATASALGAGVIAALALVVAAPAGAANDPAFAGLTRDGTVYQSADDGLWHQIDKATLAGHVPTWYGDLPGSIGYPFSPGLTPSLPAPAPAKAATLAGLLSNGSVYLAKEDGLWHAIDSATRAKLGLNATVVTWYGSLPGTIGDPVSA